MKIINDELLKPDKAPQKCETCYKRARLEPHHIYRRGLGGGSRLDIAINIVWVCRDCHAKDSNAKLRDQYREDCLLVVAMREGCEPDDIVAVIEAVIGLPKNASSDECYATELGLPSKKAVGLYEAIMDRHGPDAWQYQRRIQIATESIKDGCQDCADRFCGKHMREIAPLVDLPDDEYADEIEKLAKLAEHSPEEWK